MTSGPDDNLWFTYTGQSQSLNIGRTTTAGVTNFFYAGSTLASVLGVGIAAGPDGNLWFADRGGVSQTSDRVVRITPAGAITEFHFGAIGNGGITAGPDGNLWFAKGGNRIVRMTPTGEVTEVGPGLPLGQSAGAIVSGPDGNLWFTQTGAGDRIVRLTPARVTTQFRAGIQL